MDEGERTFVAKFKRMDLPLMIEEKKLLQKLILVLHLFETAVNTSSFLYAANSG